ncbi:MAG TPA: oligopeptide:H+ symporter [Phenylobacterium sp.]|uniref:peptide MFS transporter n=1 Tax=Phenylobacterium sp. TaxID=1871053 RepID=UPI002B47D677|nr:oligopeptide:H+ symporter [Phenylobacterium sp.]HKR87817.1 oligopeptide:H+ symporter [Phenylobacterium sp.]
MDIVFVAGLVVTFATAVPVALQLRQHPRGLAILFFAEMWERFSYYGMRGLLIFFLTQQFLMDDRQASAGYGAYTALVYLMPLIGGVLADRLLGTRKAVAFGALLLVAGHTAMAFEGRPAVQELTWRGAKYEFVAQGRAEDRIVRLKVGEGLYDYAPTADGGLAVKGLPAAAPLPPVLPKGAFSLSVRDDNPVFKDIMYLALALIIMGVGFLKANISSIVGQLYPQDDPRRDPGFTLYYYGVNVGAFWAAIACGWLGQRIGWWAGFGAAGVGMLLGYLVFMVGQPLLEGHGGPPDPQRLKRPLLGPLSTEASTYLLSLAGVVVVFFVVQSGGLVGALLGAGTVLVLGYLGWYMVTQCSRVERERMMLALVLVAGSVVFWALYEQGGSSLNQFAERNVDLRLWAGQSMTAAQAQSFQGAGILLLAPVISAIWAWLGARGRDPNPVFKFAIGLLMVGASFFVIVFGARFAGPDFKTPLIYLAVAYTIQTTGELFLSPVGLSEMTKLAPRALISTMMATWFLGTAGAQWLAAQIAALTAADTVSGQVLDAGRSLATYNDVFLKIGAGGVAAGVVMLALSPWLKRWAHAGAYSPADQPDQTVIPERAQRVSGTHTH